MVTLYKIDDVTPLTNNQEGVVSAGSINGDAENAANSTYYVDADQSLPKPKTEYSLIKRLVYLAKANNDLSLKALTDFIKNDVSTKQEWNDAIIEIGNNNIFRAAQILGVLQFYKPYLARQNPEYDRILGSFSSGIKFTDNYSSELITLRKLGLTDEDKILQGFRFFILGDIANALGDRKVPSMDKLTNQELDDISGKLIRKPYLWIRLRVRISGFVVKNDKLFICLSLLGVYPPVKDGEYLSILSKEPDGRYKRWLEYFQQNF